MVVDVQEKLVPAVHEHERVVANCAWLMKVAVAVGVPVLVSEQYSKGLGPTVADLRALAKDDAVMEKVHFSCVSDTACRDRIETQGKGQLVVCGIEAHVCVLQTTLDLLATGRQVFVAADAVSSRDPEDARLALERMRDTGAAVVSKEMVLFEWAHKADTDQFKALSKNFLK